MTQRTTPASPVYCIRWGAVEYRGGLDAWLDVNADALEGFMSDDDLYEIRSLAPGGGGAATS
jgi:hypothetical protein